MTPTLIPSTITATTTHLIQVTARRLRRGQLVRIQLQLAHNILDQFDKVLVLVLQQKVLGHLNRNISINQNPDYFDSLIRYKNTHQIICNLFGIHVSDIELKLDRLQPVLQHTMHRTVLHIVHLQLGPFRCLVHSALRRL